MRRLFLIIGIAMTTLKVSAQTTSTYGDLRAKLLHVGQQFTGRNTVNDQAYVRPLNWATAAASPSMASTFRTAQRTSWRGCDVQAVPVSYN